MKAARLEMVASACLLGLIGLCVAWEGWLAPLRPGGSWMILKVVPLMPAVFGILKGRRYTYQWSSMLILLYLTEGVLRVFDPMPVAALAGIEIVLSSVFFLTTLVYARQTAPSRSGAD